jgi:transcriptional regulator with XRE-family HTH domain
MQESIGHRLRLMRAERGLSLREAARRAGVVKETISGIERGHTHPYDVTLAKLARAYDVPLEDLLGESVPLDAPLPVLDPWAMLAERDATRRAAALEAATYEDRERYITELNTAIERCTRAISQEAATDPVQEAVDTQENTGFSVPFTESEKKELRAAHSIKMRKLFELRDAYTILRNEVEPIVFPDPYEARTLLSA